MELGNLFDKINEKAEQGANISTDDYVGEDGLLVCGKCHTPKQCRINFLGQEKTPFCLCKCEKEKHEAEDRARKQAEETLALVRRIRKNREMAFPDVDPETPPEDDMRNWTFANDDNGRPELSTAAKNYVEYFERFRREGKGLLLYGSVGTGKSFMAGCIANALLDKGISVCMTSFGRIENTVFGMRGDRQDYYDSLNRYSLLILDDFGAERSTEYMQEIVYNVIDSRSRANLPLILTSNLTSDELKNPKGIMAQRIYSRILQMCHPIRVDGDDRRKRKAVAGYAEMRKLLGI